jgi:tRNA1(Val) A37 N6-methylase TrmN6
VANYKTDQEEFWAGEFGNEYIKRNTSYYSNIPLFSKIFSLTTGVKSIIEFGANIGMNLKAIRHILPEVELSAVEINKKAITHLKKKLKILRFTHLNIRL